ncbi:hypothetical protein [Acidisphaera rubrifaciens]|uniref:Uncharacterized protein n=1 Tax=Acidisphaera rubrifaciens HS-AP3 TaxID=1231350 RepID=A0A0D6P5Q2_9PROT|nr:hypothetical protein [Acidisphaera rubrifaciens]GAN76194.1 hypothetical protein Asru_0073_05 [Acidisphaera rubrifaciens HS-AP3]
MRRALILGLALAALAPALAAAARYGVDPDWPCQSIKVADLSLGTMWTGPPVDAYAQTWQQDPQVAPLAQRLVQRRLPVDEATAEVKRFAATLGADRSVKLPMLMAAVFDLMDTERRAVVDGLDRFGRRQKELAASLRAEASGVNAETTAPNADAAKISAAMQRLEWDRRVFDSRRQSIEYACAVPSVIEQRLFALARAIQAELPQTGK